MRPNLRSPHRPPAQQGYVLGLVGLLIVPLLGFVALATDVGAWYSEAAEMQRAADAAALAGVVWMPDEAKAESVALEVAAKNGYRPADPNISVVVAPIPGNQNQLEVTIRNTDPPVYFSGPFVGDVNITREATAEYVLPVPLGNPRNHLGTGDLANPDEGFWLSLNGFCTPFEHGGLKGPRFAGNNYGGSGTICPTTASAPAGPGPNSAGGNSSYEDNQYYDGSSTYEFYIEHPDNSEDTEILIYDPGMHDSSASPDFEMGHDGDVTTTFRILAADLTPLTDTDNVPFTGCSNRPGSSSQTYANNDTSVHTHSALGSNRWALFCTIPAGAQAGRYILSIEPQVGEANSNAFNNYALLVRRASLGDICDSRLSTRCPQVYSKEWMSIHARADSPDADFFLSEVEDAHEGKILQIVLYDPGEGGNQIRVVDPAGNYVDFDWETWDGNDGGTGSAIDVSGTVTPRTGRSSNSRYNERFLDIRVPLPADFTTAYPSGNRWWKIFYDYNRNPTDRTTWSAQIIGDPVRLIE